MYLSRIEIENFRGIRSARIDFGETTVLIGENDSGKTTLLEAICLILSPRPESKSIFFRPQDFFMVTGPTGYQPVGPLLIRLAFRERKPDEWSFMQQNELGLVLKDDRGVLQELTLEVKANPDEFDNVLPYLRMLNAKAAYAMGLVEPLGSFELLKLLLHVPFPPGALRAAALGRFRSVFGRVLARKLNLPVAHEEVLGSTGRVAAGSTASEHLIFFAKQLIPSEHVGPEWTSEDPALADRYAALNVDPALPQLIARDTTRLREILPG